MGRQKLHRDVGNTVDILYQLPSSNPVRRYVLYFDMTHTTAPIRQRRKSARHHDWRSHVTFIGYLPCSLCAVSKCILITSPRYALTAQYSPLAPQS